MATRLLRVCHCLEHCLHLIVDILCSEAKFLIKNLVRRRESETFEAEHLAVASYKSLKVYRETCCKSEYLCTAWKDALLVLLCLASEESL